MQTWSFLDIIHLAAYHSSCMGPYMNVPSRKFPPRVWAHSIRYRWFVTSSSVEHRYYYTIRKSLLGFDEGSQRTKTCLLWVPYAKVLRVYISLGTWTKTNIIGVGVKVVDILIIPHARPPSNYNSVHGASHHKVFSLCLGTLHKV
jgi:hypothetical protein